MIKILDMFGKVPKHYEFSTYVVSSKAATIEGHRVVEPSGHAHTTDMSDVCMGCVSVVLTCELIVLLLLSRGAEAGSA